MHDQLFYIGQKALIVKDNKVLVLFRDDSLPDLPGSKIQIGEVDVIAAVKREVKEETNLTISVGKILGTTIIELPQHIIDTKAKKSRYIYLVLYEATSVSGEITLSEEHTSYKWLSREEYNALGDRRLLMQAIVLKYFAHKH